MKGILLAGGSGTRLYPVTKVVSKQLLPIYDKPMIYYPLSILMTAGIQEVLIISTPTDLPLYERLLGDGSNLGMKFSYKVQPAPEGLAQAFILGEDFIKNGSVCLVLGDNILYGEGLKHTLVQSSVTPWGGKIFAYRVSDPERYGVVEFDELGKVLSLEEKPKSPRSNYAVPGVYFYDDRVSSLAKKLKPSPRGELEITDLNLEYLKLGELSVEVLGTGIAWLDTGTSDSLIEATNFVQTIEKRQGIKIACIEEIAFKKGWITESKLVDIMESLGKSSYAQYLRNVLVGVV